MGSKNERPGRSGFAHLFEHLMFYGSEHSPHSFFDVIEPAGATDLNGTTNEDRTNYFENVPVNALDLALFAAALRNPSSERYASESAPMYSRISSTDLFAAISWFLRRSIHSVVARRNRRRTRDAHVHFFRAGIAHHAHDLSGWSCRARSSRRSGRLASLASTLRTGFNFSFTPKSRTRCSGSMNVRPT